MKVFIHLDVSVLWNACGRRFTAYDAKKEKVGGRHSLENYLNATNSLNFLKSEFIFPLHCLPLGSYNPSVQSDNNLTIADQVIVLGAPGGSH